MDRIALIGLDGSGKSTNLDKLKFDLKDEQYAFMWCRWKPSLLKFLFKSINKKTKTAELNEEYQKKRKIKDKLFKYAVVRFIWQRLAYLDYRITFMKNYRKVKKKKIIFDRYYYDLFIDLGINFKYDYEKIEKTILKYQKRFPKIEKVIYIKASPEVCLSRKNDIPNIDYLIKRYKIYEKLSYQLQWIIINGEQPLDDVYAEVKKIVTGD